MCQLVSCSFLAFSLKPCLKSGPSLNTDDILIATDLKNVCPLLDENLSTAAGKSQRTDHPTGPRILVRPLEWGNPDHALKVFTELNSRSLTHIICSDLVSFLHHSK